MTMIGLIIAMVIVMIVKMMLMMMIITLLMITTNLDGVPLVANPGVGLVRGELRHHVSV